MMEVPRALRRIVEIGEGVWDGGGLHRVVESSGRDLPVRRKVVTVGGGLR